MKLSQSITVLKKYLPLYLLTIIIAFVMRYISKIGDSDILSWILAPTAWWVSILSGIRFEYIPHMGYVNHFYRFLIAPACSGSRFMLIIFLMLTFSFLYRIKSVRSGCIWFGFSAIFSYIFTIFVNGVRITVSVYIPIVLENMGLIKGWLTQDRLHTIIGTTVYFSFMLGAYPLADVICRHIFLQKGRNMLTAQPEIFAAPSIKLVIPVCWYFLAVLVIPFIGRVYRNEWEGFGQYAALIGGVCLAVIIAGCLMGGIVRSKRRYYDADS